MNGQLNMLPVILVEMLFAKNLMLMILIKISKIELIVIKIKIFMGFINFNVAVHILALHHAILDVIQHVIFSQVMEI